MERIHSMESNGNNRENNAEENVDDDMMMPQKRNCKRRPVLQSDSDEENDTEEGAEAASNGRVLRQRQERRELKRTRFESDSSSTSSSSESEEETEDVVVPAFVTQASRGRRDLRPLLLRSELQPATLRAERAETQRVQRIAIQRQQFPGIRVDNNVDEVKELFLDRDLPVHASLRKVLKPHQAEGLQFIFDSLFESLTKFQKGEGGNGGILAHCMGLGKTLQVIAFVHTVLTAHQLMDKIKKVLILVPVNVLDNWKVEFDKWLAKNDPELNRFSVFSLHECQNDRERIGRLETWFEQGGVMICGYSRYWRSLEEPSDLLLRGNRREIPEDVKKAYIKYLRSPGPDIVICDEAHRLKNSKTKLYMCLSQITTRRRLCLTGTPLQNNLMEYYCMVSFVRQNLLGTVGEYKNRFMNPINNGQYKDSTPDDVRIMKGRCHVLNQLLKHIVMRKDITPLVEAIPPKHEYVLSIRLCQQQVQLYSHYLHKIIKYIDSESLAERKMLFLDYCNFYRIWTHPHLLLKKENREQLSMHKMKTKRMASKNSQRSIDSDDSDNEESDTDNEYHLPSVYLRWASKSGLVKEEDRINVHCSGKIKVLIEIIKICEKVGDKLLVFSRSLESLNLIEYFLCHLSEGWFNDGHNAKNNDTEQTWGWVKNVDYFRIDGSVPTMQRHELQQLFNQKDEGGKDINPRGRLFLISTKAGSLGINMVAANRVVIFDACWNPTHDTQSLFRAYRFGQTKETYVYRLVAQCQLVLHWLWER